MKALRTTLTLDADVAVALERLRKVKELSLKAAVNEALRAGLEKLQQEDTPAAPFRTEGASLGRLLVPSLDDVSEALAIAEGEHFR